MQWLVYGNLDPAAAAALVRHGHRVHGPEELGLPPEAGAGEVLAAAEERQWDVLTNDAALANAPFDPEARFNRSLVYLHLAGGDVEQDDAIDRLFDRCRRLAPRRLYTVTGSRVKIRQLPGGTSGRDAR